MPSSKFEDRPLIQKGFDKTKHVRETQIESDIGINNLTEKHATCGSQASQCSEFSQST
jgi:hypothetical protein